MKMTPTQREYNRVRCARYRAHKAGKPYMGVSRPVERTFTWKCPSCLAGFCRNHEAQFPVMVHADGHRIQTTRECECGHGA